MAWSGGGSGVRPVITARLIFNRTGDLSQRVRRRVWNAIRETASEVEKDVKGGPHSLYRAYPETPRYRRTGNLGRSYHVEFDEHALRAVVASDPGIAPYTAYVELGTENMPAKPHFGPSVEAVRERWERRMREAVDDAV
jgi:hypothetical protein